MQRYIAMETLQVFAPLARLLGMYRIKVFFLSTSLTLPWFCMQLLHTYSLLCYLQNFVVEFSLQPHRCVCASQCCDEVFLLLLEMQKKLRTQILI
jgi:hypothetical protein